MIWPNGVLGVVVLALLIVAWRKRRKMLRERIDQPAPRVDDRTVERILSEGRVETDEDEPLDQDEIDEEERRFWDGEGWDPAERF